MDSELSPSESPSARARQNRKRKTLRLIGWIFLPIGFIGLSIFAAKLGIAMGRADLPESAKVSTAYPVGIVVVAGRDGDPVFFAETVQELRNFYFQYPEIEQRREANLDGETKIRRVFGRVELATLKSDADGVQVQIRTGPLADEVYWIHKSQLPAQN
ncbi:MAG: hypothetical protein HKN23_05865 [Verrucomicrobiales bacterium]|nr:hypothetical protein [Verrucomicrobiales bacterium]